MLTLHNLLDPQGDLVHLVQSHLFVGLLAATGKTFYTDPLGLYKADVDVLCLSPNIRQSWMVDWNHFRIQHFLKVHGTKVNTLVLATILYIFSVNGVCFLFKKLKGSAMEIIQVVSEDICAFAESPRLFYERKQCALMQINYIFI